MAKTHPAVRVDDDTGRELSTTDTTFALTLAGADCRSEKLKFRFSLDVVGFDMTHTLQAWASRAADCAQEYTSSTVPNQARSCWRVARFIPVVNGVATVEIPPGQLLGIGVDADVAGIQRPLRQSCDEVALGDGRQAFDVYFLLTGADDRVQASTTQRLYYALNGPTPPRLLSLTPWDDSLKLEWASGGGFATEVVYEYYCAPNEDPVGCHSSTLERFGAAALTANAVSSAGGQPLDHANLYQSWCGRAVGLTNTQGVIEAPLEPGQSYAAAVAVRDLFGNLGSLSNYLCATPQPSDDVAEPLSGRACTGCAVPHPGRSSWLLTLLGFAVLTLRRRDRD